MSRSPPTGRLGRVFRLAEVGVRTGAALLHTRGVNAAAERTAEVLGDLRGLAAKIGQMASYVDGFVPEGQREIYQRALSQLQNAAPSSSPDSVRRLVERELGRSLESAFASWEPEPFASASIGQVHAATLHSGEAVAVKVQHEGIEQAIESDLSNVGSIQRLVSGLGPKNLNAAAMYEVVRDRFREELDYQLEARHAAFFRHLHEADPNIHVPRLIETHSTRRVLTTELVTGMTLEQASEQELTLRKRFATALWRFVFKGNLVGGRFNADPHPGNYVFHADGSVTFLDFGCVQVLGPDHVERAREMHRAAIERDEAGFRRHCAALLGTRGGSYEAAALDYSRYCFEPLFASPFHLTRAYTSELAGRIAALKRHMLAKDRSFVQLPAEMVFLNRLQFGFYSVIARLDVELDFAAIERTFLPQP
jgi:predicted unusual protein kinase regulating ubiquinone biosynthesis (AarF/ABC1/UbiB family)